MEQKVASRVTEVEVQCTCGEKLLGSPTGLIICDRCGAAYYASASALTILQNYQCSQCAKSSEELNFIVSYNPPLCSFCANERVRPLGKFGSSQKFRAEPAAGDA